MAAKKKSEIEEVVEEIKEVETTEVVEEAPKKKRTSKKKTEEPKEEIVAEEVKPEPEVEVEVVGNFAVEIKQEEVKKEESKVEPKGESFIVQVVSPTGIFTFKNPGLDQPKGKVYAKGSKLTVTEVNGNWGKVGEGKWILLSNTVVKL